MPAPTLSGCVAGTLVHTETGLKPIEQIKVGDRVLSRSESGEGALCYQPVTETFTYEDRELYFVYWQCLVGETDKLTEETGFVVVTGAHPIWVEKLIDSHFVDLSVSLDTCEVETGRNSWMTIEEIYRQRWVNRWEKRSSGFVRPYVRLSNGVRALIGIIHPILQSDDPEIGACFDDTPSWEESLYGHEICFTPEGPRITVDGTIIYGRDLAQIDLDAYDYNGYDTENPMSVVNRSGGFLPMRRKVYNLAVAETHTYFVTEGGLWVRPPGTATSA